ncbi:MAG: hypothetical protein AUI14_00190 [Actinobacteria bacterium 13_2_20CM_2_71_6]|nr:MAG: hypothetical protein AUI14_00190 [Actinobacteria bacterium 13_2_20CM_2_71_6]
MAARDVLISGCGSGIGWATALEFARAGDRVWAGVRSERDAVRLRQAAADEVLDIRPVPLDVRSPEDVLAAVRTVLATSGGLDVLVNNAAIFQVAPVETTTDEDAALLFEVNLLGPLRLIRAVLPVMRERGGVVVNVSSVNGFLAAPFSALYSATKFALEGLSEALQAEVLPFGIRVVLAEPGGFRTGMAARARASGGAVPEAYRDAVRRMAELRDAGLRDAPDVRLAAREIYLCTARAGQPLRQPIGPAAVQLRELRGHSDEEIISQIGRRLWAEEPKAAGHPA